MRPWILVKPSVSAGFLKPCSSRETAAEHCDSQVRLEVQVSHLASIDIQEEALYYCLSGVGILAPHLASTDTCLAGRGWSALLLLPR